MIKILIGILLRAGLFFCAVVDWVGLIWFAGKIEILFFLATMPSAFIGIIISFMPTKLLIKHWRTDLRTIFIYLYSILLVSVSCLLIFAITEDGQNIAVVMFRAFYFIIGVMFLVFILSETKSKSIK